MQLCGYLQGGAPLDGAPRVGLPVTGPSAQGLADIVSAGAGGRARLRRCRYRPSSTLAVFRYADRSPVRLLVVEPTCGPAYASLGAVRIRLAPPAASQVSSLAGAYAFRDARGPRVPEVSGGSLPAARARSAGSHYRLAVDGEAIVDGVPVGTVLTQHPPAGVVDDLGLHQVEVTIAVPQARLCNRDQLGLRFSAGGRGAGSAFATIELRDRGDRPCRLPAPVRVVGLGRRGDRRTRSSTDRARQRLVITPSATQPQVVARLELSAAYRDDPRSEDGLCTAHQVVPARWRLRFDNGVTRTVDGRDPHGHGLITCRGEINRGAEIAFGLARR